METRRRFQNTDLEAATARGGRPVDHAPRIVRAIIAYGRGSSWVGDGTAGADDVQRWVMQRQGQAPEWQDARIHEQVHVVVQRSFAFEKPERIAAPQAH